MKTVNLRKQKSHNYANLQHIEEIDPSQPKMNFILSGTQRTDKKLVTLRAEDIQRYDNHSKIQYSHKDLSQSSFINDAKIDVTGSKHDLITETANTMMKTNHSKSSKPNLIFKNDQNKDSTDKLQKPAENKKPVENNEHTNYDKNIQNIINQRKMVDMQINNTSTAVEEKLIFRQKNNQHYVSSFSSDTLPKTDYKNLEN